MRRQRIILLLSLLVALSAPGRDAIAQVDRVEQLEQRVHKLEQSMQLDHQPGDWGIIGYGAAHVVTSLWIALFCGFWARSTGRDFGLWFAAGGLFHFFALIAVWIDHDKAAKETQRWAFEAKRRAVKEAARNAVDPA